MELTPYQEDVYSARICPYCKSETKIVTEEFIYGRTYSGRVIICCKNYPKCDAFIGTHRDGRPLGRLANKDLRKWKRATHEAFDRLWLDGIFKRQNAYRKLSKEFGFHPDYTHISMFNIKTCKKVIKWSNETYKNHKK